MFIYLKNRMRKSIKMKRESSIENENDHFFKENIKKPISEQ